MHLMYRRFDETRAKFWERLIAASTYGPLVHVELRMNDGRFFSSAAGTGVRILEPDAIDASDLSTWEIQTLPWCESPEAVAWAESVVGRPYDYLGALSSGTGLGYSDPGKWFCSEACIEFLSRCGVLDVPPLLNPNALHDYVRAMLAGADQQELDSIVRHHYTQFAALRSATTPANEYDELCRSCCDKLVADAGAARLELEARLKDKEIA